MLYGAGIQEKRTSVKKVHYIILGAVIGVGLIVALAVKGNANGSGAQVESAMPTDTLRSLADEVNTIRYFAAKLPKTLTFAGEEVPLDDPEVRERLDRELTVTGYWHSNTIQNLKLANRWFPIIESTLKKNGVPEDFKYLAMAESGLRNVISPSGAHGYWQFLENTGEHYGLTINGEVDERYDMEKSCEAASQYFKDAYAKFNNWTLAAASCDAGMGAIEGAVNYQDEKSYYDLYFREETSRYVFRSLAFKIIYEHTQDYGFFLTKEDLYDPLQYKEVTVTTSIPNLSEFAKKNGTNYKMLKYYNPWLRSDMLTVKAGQQYRIKIPA